MWAVLRLLRLVTALLLVGTVAAVGAPAASADQVRDGQYWLEDLNLPAAWEISRGAGVIVGVVDSGANTRHPDLAGALLPGTVINSDPTTDDPVGHGTAVSVLLAGRGHDGDDGTLGVAPEAMLLPITADSGSNWLQEGIRWAVDHGARVINVSSGGYYGEAGASGYHDSLAYAESRDVVVVASAGKGDGAGRVSDLASRAGVVAVSAVDGTATFRPDVSNQGPDVELAAPGVAMPMLAEDGDAGFRLATFTGTSFSAPIVAGTAALIRSEYPELNAASVVQRLVSTATDAGPPGHDPQYGHGIVNPVAALTAEVTPVAENPLGSVTDLMTAPAPPVAQGPPESSAGERVSLGMVFAVLGGAVVLGGAAVLVVVLLVRRRRRPALVRHPPPAGPWR